MKTLFTKSALVGVSTLIFAATANAAYIIGDIDISQSGSTTAINFTTNTVTFTPGAPTANAKVDSASGNFSSLLGSNIAYSDFSYDPLAVSGGGPIWVGTGVSFTLTSLTSVTEVGTAALVLFGKGYVSLAGYDSTPGVWSFTASTTGTTFNFGSTTTATNVPDGGATVALFGASMLGLFGFRRKFAKN